MVFGGDLRQIPPFVKHGSRTEVVSSCLNRSYLWCHIKVMKLTFNMHVQILSPHDASEVSDFSNLLLRVGEGTEPEYVSRASKAVFARQFRKVQS